MREARQGGSMD